MADSKSGSRSVTWIVILAVLGGGAFIIYNQVKPPTEFAAPGIAGKAHTVEVKLLGSGAGSPPAEVVSKFLKDGNPPTTSAAWAEVQVIGDGAPRRGGEFMQLAVQFTLQSDGKDWPVNFVKTEDSVVIMVPEGYPKAPGELTLKVTAKGKPDLGSWKLPALPAPKRRLEDKPYPTSVDIMPGVTVSAIRGPEGINLNVVAKDALPEGQLLGGRFGGHDFKAARYNDNLPRTLLMGGGRPRGGMGFRVPAAYMPDLKACDADITLYKVTNLSGSATVNGATFDITDTEFVTNFPSPAVVNLGTSGTVTINGTKVLKGLQDTAAISAELKTSQLLEGIEVSGTSPFALSVKGKPDDIVFGEVQGEKDKKKFKAGPLSPLKLDVKAMLLTPIKSFHVTLALSEPPPRPQRGARAQSG